MTSSQHRGDSEAGRLNRRPSRRVPEIREARRSALLVYVLALSAVLYGLLRPQPAPELFEHSDKWMHAVAFVVLGISGRMAFWARSALVFWTLSFTAAFGLEIVQGIFQPTRMFSVVDALANGVGLVVALVFMAVARRYFNKFWLAV